MQNCSSGKLTVETVLGFLTMWGVRTLAPELSKSRLSSFNSRNLFTQYYNSLSDLDFFFFFFIKSFSSGVIASNTVGGTSGKESACQCRRWKRHGFYPWVRKILWKRKRQLTSVILPGKSSGQEPGDPQSMRLQDQNRLSIHTKNITSLWKLFVSWENIILSVLLHIFKPLKSVWKVDMTCHLR